MGLILIIFFGGLVIFYLKEWLFDYSFELSDLGKKEIKIWFSKWLYDSLIGVSYSLLLIETIWTFVALSNEHWKVGIILFLTTIIHALIARRFRKKYRIKKKWIFETFENINSNGFEIQVIKNKKIQSVETILWSDIKKVIVSKRLTKVFKKNGKRIILSFFTKHYFRLIRQLPNYCSDVTTHQVNEVFRRFKPCLICGSVAADYSSCKACGTHVWSKTFNKHYENKGAYVKAKQLDLFASLHKKDLQSLTFSRDETFKLYGEWKLLVTEEEILKYSKKRFWIL